MATKLSSVKKYCLLSVGSIGLLLIVIVSGVLELAQLLNSGMFVDSNETHISKQDSFTNCNRPDLIHWRAATPDSLVDAVIRNKWCLIEINDLSDSVPTGDVYFYNSIRVHELILSNQIEAFSVPDASTVADAFRVLDVERRLGGYWCDNTDKVIAACLINRLGDCFVLTNGTEAEFLEILSQIEIWDLIAWKSLSKENLIHSASFDRWILVDGTQLAISPVNAWEYRNSETVASLLLAKGIDCYFAQGELASKGAAEFFQYYSRELIPTLPNFEFEGGYIGAFYNFNKKLMVPFYKGSEDEFLAVLENIESNEKDIIPWILPTADNLNNSIKHDRWILLLNEKQSNWCNRIGHEDYRRSSKVRELLISLGVDCYQVGGVFSSQETEKICNRKNRLVQEINALDESMAGSLINFNQRKLIPLVQGTEAEVTKSLKLITKKNTNHSLKTKGGNDR